MNVGKHRIGVAVGALRILGTMMLLATCWLGVAPSVAGARQGQTSDIAIVTLENGQPAYDACYVLVGYGNEGCDQNGDGEITFQDVPLGTYTLRQTADLGPDRSVADTTITVTGAMDADGWERFYATIETQAGTSVGLTRQVAIFTNENGQPAYDACYVLVGYGNEGCDENRDGRVMFADIPWGTYTVRQTADLGPGRGVDDFTIQVRGNVSSAGWEGFSATIVDSSGSSSASVASGSVDIALITRDPETGAPLTGACYVLADYSNEGCDENGDGQVTFADIPFGTYTVRQTQTPAGYPTINDYAINVEPVVGMPGGDSFGVPLGFIVKQAPDQNAPETRNVSVVLIDMTTREKLVGGACVQLVDASLVGCDEDVRDGQIDFLDVPAGGPYELRFTDLAAGYEVGTVGGPLRVRVDAEPGAPANQMVFVLFATPNGDAPIERAESANSDADSGRSPSAEVIGEDGFSLTRDGVSVSGAPGVAPMGTPVYVRSITQDLTDDVDGFADAVGTGLEITLGEGFQPASPLTITFAPEAVSEWYAAAESGGDLVPVVFISKADGSGMELADAELLPDGSVEVAADHLSEVQPGLASIGGFAGWLTDQIDIGIQVRSDRPDCVDQREDDLGWEFSAVPDQLIWPCLVGTAGELDVTFQNNSPQVWFVTSDQATAGIPIPTSLSVTGAALASAAGLGIDQRTTAPLVPPDGQVSFSADGSQDRIVFNASLNEPLTIANALITGVSAVLPQKRIEAVADAVGRTDCLLDLLETAPNVDERVDAGDVGSVTGTMIRCVGELAKGLGGNLISGVASFPGAVRAISDTINLNERGRDEFAITLSRSDGAPGGPSFAWPTDRDEGPGVLYTWLGANMFDFPDWVACDDARDYCLVGYAGEEHVLVQIDGLDVVGYVADSATDPRQDLLALGLPDEIVAQILGLS